MRAGTQTHGYLEYFNKTIEQSARGNPYSLHVAPRVRIPGMSIHDAARTFVEPAAAPIEHSKTAN